MIIKDLNRIQKFIEEPSLEGFNEIFKLFDNPIAEEFFWLKSALVNQKLILFISNNKLKLSERYLTNLEEDYSNVRFYFLRFLVQVSKEDNKSSEIYKTLEEIIKPFVETEIKNKHASNSQALAFISEIIFEFPLTLISQQHLSLISKKALNHTMSYVGRYAVETFIPRVVKEKNKPILLQIFDKLFFNVYNEKGIKETDQNSYDGFNLSKLIDPTQVKTFAEIIGTKDLLDFSISKLLQAAKANSYNFSSFSIPTIEDSSQIFDQYKYDYILVKFLRTQLEVNSFELDTIKKLLNSETAIVRRLAVYYMNKHYSQCRNSFWKETTLKILNDFEIKHEMFMLLKENSNLVTQGELNIFFTWLDNIIVQKWDDKITDEDLKNFKIVEIKEYLQALRESNSEIKPIIEKKYSELTEQYSVEREHPGYNSYFGHSVSQQAEEVVSDSFNTKEFEQYFKIIQSGFKDLDKNEANKIFNRFKYLLSRNLIFILENQADFLELEFKYLSEIPYYFEKAWGGTQPLEMSKVFSFIGAVVDKKWSVEGDKWDSFIGYSAWLIKASTRDDSNAISGQELIDAKNLCLKFLNLRIKSERLNNDPFFDIMNSTDGKIYDATINVLLRNARINKKDSADKWYSDIKTFYSNDLKEGLQTDALLWSISSYLPQFGFLDMHWVNEMIDYIFPKDKLELWKLSMRVYHKYCSTVYKPLFELLSKNGHYNLALKIFVDGQIGTEDVFQHIVIAYTAGWEEQQLSKSNSLIVTVIKGSDYSQIHGFISYFLKSKNSNREKILTLWEAILRNAKANSKLYQSLLSLTGSIGFIDDRAFEIIEFTLKGIDEKEELYQFIHELFSLKDKNLKFVALLLIGCKVTNFERYYLRGDFENITIQLYANDPKLADTFVENMVQKRLFQLLDIHNSYHKESLIN